MCTALTLRMTERETEAQVHTDHTPARALKASSSLGEVIYGLHNGLPKGRPSSTLFVKKVTCSRSQSSWVAKLSVGECQQRSAIVELVLPAGRCAQGFVATRSVTLQHTVTSSTLQRMKLGRLEK
jgi:hypothetical protein